MHLDRLKIQGFRCLFALTDGYEDPPAGNEDFTFESQPGVEVQLGRLTLFIGCNDSGKSSILDILEIVLNNERPDTNDFHCWFEDVEEGDEPRLRRADEIRALLQFQLDEKDSEASAYAINNTLTVRAAYTPDRSIYMYWGEKPEDERLDQDFGRLKASEQKQLIEQLDPGALSGLSNSEKRVAWLSEYANTAPKVGSWLQTPRELTSMLPRFERYSTMDYDSPGRFVLKTLKQVYENVIYEEIEKDGSVGRRPVKALRDLKAEVERSIHNKVQELVAYIKCYNSRVKTISYDPTLDFSGGLKDGQFQIDDGRGLTYLSKVGDGTKRRVFMAVVDWDREVTLAQAKNQSALPPIIRGYDEPDTNLDYSAQRMMYQSISDIVGAENSRIQALICTHSPRLIDRAPAHKIRLLQLKEGRTVVSKLKTDKDPSIEAFLTDIARELGLSNTLMFYEQCFILIEGQTEENALPMLYKTKYGHSLLEDAIRVIPVYSNGAFKEFFRILSRNRQEITLVFADLDTEAAPTGRKLTREILNISEFTEDFVESHVIYVPATQIEKNGTEFEAAFSDDIICRCLQENWPKVEGAWMIEDIASIRKEENKKFSDELKARVYAETEPGGIGWSKPCFGKFLGTLCPEDDIPGEILALFERAREISLGN